MIDRSVACPSHSWAAKGWPGRNLKPRPPSWFLPEVSRFLGNAQGVCGVTAADAVLSPGAERAQPARLTVRGRRDGTRRLRGSLLGCGIIPARQEKEGKSDVVFLPQRPGWAIWQSSHLGARMNNMLWVTL